WRVVAIAATTAGTAASTTSSHVRARSTRSTRLARSLRTSGCDDERGALASLLVGDDRARDLARLHRLERLVDLAHTDLARDQLVEHELAVLVETEQLRHVLVDVRGPVPAALDRLVEVEELERGGDLEHHVHARDADQHGLATVPCEA